LGGVCLIMVKLIPTHKRQLLANFEVLEILNQHQISEKEKAKNKRKPVKSDEALNTVTLETVNYLKRTPASKQNTESVTKFVTEIKNHSDGAKLLPNEILQFINLSPTKPVELNLLVEDIEERIEEDNVDTLCELVETHFGEN